MKRLFTLALCLAYALISTGVQAVHEEPTQMDIIQSEVNDSLSKILPEGARWQAIVPGFTKHSHEHINNLIIKYPDTFRDDGLLLKVWVDTEHGEKLYAVPVIVEDVSGDSDLIMSLNK